MVVSQTQQPIGDFFVLGVSLARIPITRLADPKRLAGQPDRCGSLFHGTSGHLAAARGLTTFFECLRHNLGLELFLDVHLAQPGVLGFQFFHPRH